MSPSLQASSVTASDSEQQATMKQGPSPAKQGGEDAGAFLAEADDNAAMYEPSYQEVARRSAPIVAEQIFRLVKGLIGIWLLSAIGNVAIAGAGFANTLLKIPTKIAEGYMRSIQHLTATSGRDTAGRLRSLKLALVGSCVGFLFGGLVGVILSGSIAKTLIFLHLPKDLHKAIIDYVQAYCFALPALFPSLAFAAQLRASGYAKWTMLTSIVTGFVNVLLCYLLINGLWGLPKLEVFGAGLGAAITDWLELFCLFSGWLWQNHLYKLNAPLQNPERIWQYFLHINRKGIPIALECVVVYTGYIFAPLLISTIGTEAIAAYEISLNIYLMAYFIATAIADATGIMVGEALARAHPQKTANAEGWFYCGLRSNLLVMTVWAMFYGLGAPYIVGCFTQDKEVGLLAIRCLQVASVNLFFDAAALTLQASLNVAGDIRVPAMIATVFLWLGVPLPTYLLGNVLHFGALGAWLSFILTASLLTLAFAWRWRRGYWQNNAIWQLATKA